MRRLPPDKVPDVGSQRSEDHQERPPWRLLGKGQGLILNSETKVYSVTITTGITSEDTEAEIAEAVTTALYDMAQPSVVVHPKVELEELTGDDTKPSDPKTFSIHPKTYVVRPARFQVRADGTQEYAPVAGDFDAESDAMDGLDYATEQLYLAAKGFTRAFERHELDLGLSNGRPGHHRQRGLAAPGSCRALRLRLRSRGGDRGVRHRV